MELTTCPECGKLLSPCENGEGFLCSSCSKRFRIITLENTEENRAIQQAAANMALSGMYLSEEEIGELQKVDSGKKAMDELRAEIAQKLG